MRVEVLNHASVLLDLGDVRLLSDPWFEGTAFSGGWQLRNANPGALAAASRATHLWLSHWHSDHMHMPTLGKLARLTPDITVLANVSANFSMIQPLRKLGFTNVFELGERRPLPIGDGVQVTRVPTASIDNMLLVESPAGRVLNYNDCNLPLAALARLVGKLGPIDLLLCNYNHAGKLYGHEPAEVVRDRWWSMVEGVIATIAPRRVLPFASSHLYRSPLSLDQNASLLDHAEVVRRAGSDSRFVLAADGEVAEIRGALSRVSPAQTIQPEPLVPHDYGEPAAWSEVLDTAEAYVRRLGRDHLQLFAWLPEVRVRVDDHGRTLALDLRRGVREVAGDDFHMALHSRALLDWTGRKFGDDTLLAGAHFRIGDNPAPAQRLLLVSALASNELGVRHLARLLGRREGRRFFYNRREEIVATVLGARFKAGELRQ